MTHDAVRLPDYLGHILEAIARIERYTAGLDGAAFAQNSLVQDAVIRNFEIIGEASRNISKRYPDFAATHPIVCRRAIPPTPTELLNLPAFKVLRVEEAASAARSGTPSPRTPPCSPPAFAARSA